jgi:hypothetical protein
MAITASDIHTCLASESHGNTVFSRETMIGICTLYDATNK